MSWSISKLLFQTVSRPTWSKYSVYCEQPKDKTKQYKAAKNEGTPCSSMFFSFL